MFVARIVQQTGKERQQWCKKKKKGTSSSGIGGCNHTPLLQIKKGEERNSKPITKNQAQTSPSSIPRRGEDAMMLSVGRGNRRSKEILGVADRGAGSRGARPPMLI